MAADRTKISALLDSSLRSHREGKLDLARDGYIEVLQEMPENPVALNLLGTLDAQTGNLGDAERLIRRAIAQNPKEAAYYSNLANVLQQKGQHRDAIQAYRHALKLDPGLGDAYNNLGVLLLEGGLTEEAYSCFEKALASKGDTPEIHNNLGRALNNLGRLEEAELEFTKAIELNPDFAQAHLNMGYVLRARRKFTYAAASFQNAIALDPDRHSAYHGLGTVYMAQNTPEEAIECFKKALELQPDDFDTLLDLGILLHSLGRLHQSVNAYKQAISLRPDSARAFSNLGAVLLERRNLKAAESAFRQAIQIEPGLADPYAQLGAMFDEQGRLEEMQAVIQDGLAVDPDNKQLNFEAARLAERQGFPKKAIDLLTRFDLTALDSKMAQQYRYELGRACDRAGDTGMAYLHASEANRLATLNWRAHSVDLQSIPGMIDRLRVFLENSRIENKEFGQATDTPVFLLGFPGSGTDFVAEVVRHHGKIQVVPNPSTLGAVVGVASQYDGGYPACLSDIDDERLARLRQVYFAQADKVMERQADCVLVDNQTINSMHAVMIARLFCKPLTVLVVRHPCDVVLGNFMQNYSMNDTNAHFLTLEGTVALYEKSMALWQQYEKKLALDIHMIRYEDLLENLEGEITRLLRAMGLEEDDALRAYLGRLSGGGEATGSSYRLHSNPLDANSHYRWRAYADQLRPYFERLQPFVDHFAYQLDENADRSPH